MAELIAATTGIHEDPTMKNTAENSDTSVTLPEADEISAPASPTRIKDSSSPPDIPRTPERVATVTPITSPFNNNARLSRSSPSPGNLRARQTGGGLSELSKQLRILQAKNESQSVEIDRLERQLKILAELQGISVSALRSALEEACASEALAEWHSRVASLKAQLEAATIAREPATGARGVGQMEEEAVAKKMANLELRVGELEEIDEKQKAEAQQLYSQLIDQKGDIARLESQLSKAKNENEELLAEKESAKRSVEEQDLQMAAAVPAELVDIEAEKRKELEANLKEITNKAAVTATELNIVQEKLKLTEQQKSSVEEQGNLRNAQYRARFTVQDGNIKDLEQQLTSLYVAFTMLKEERNEDVAERRALQSSLGEADAEVARRLELQDKASAAAASAASTPVSSPTRSSPTRSSPTRSPPPAPTSREQIPILSSQLLVKTPGTYRQWKKMNASLMAELSHHILDVGLGETYNVYFNVASLEPHADQRNGFTVYLNRTDRQAPVLKLAATNAEDYGDWMAALSLATNGTMPASSTAAASVVRAPAPPEWYSANPDNSGVI